MLGDGVCHCSQVRRFLDELHPSEQVGHFVIGHVDHCSGNHPHDVRGRSQARVPAGCGESSTESAVGDECRGRGGILAEQRYSMGKEICKGTDPEDAIGSGDFLRLHEAVRLTGDGHRVDVLHSFWSKRGRGELAMRGPGEHRERQPQLVANARNVPRTGTAFRPKLLRRTGRGSPGFCELPWLRVSAALAALGRHNMTIVGGADAPSAAGFGLLSHATGRRPDDVLMTP